MLHLLPLKGLLKSKKFIETVHKTLQYSVQSESRKSLKKEKVTDSIHNQILSPAFSSCYDFPLTTGPNVFFLGAVELWGLGFGADAGFLALGCRDLRPNISQYTLHWCKALNWSMKEVPQFPLNPLYLQRKKITLRDQFSANSQSIFGLKKMYILTLSYRWLFPHQ